MEKGYLQDLLAYARADLMNFVILNNIPLPPSINKAYFNNRSGKGPGRIKSGAYRLFERDLQVWTLRHRFEAEAAMQLIGKSGWFNLHVCFCLPYKILVTKDGRPKRHDVDNRLKLLNDAMGKVLGFDDCRIASQRIEKVASHNLEVGHVSVLFERAARDLSTQPSWAAVRGAF